VYQDANPSIKNDPYEREMETIERRKALTRKITEQGISIDSQVATDTRRIFRFPGTINSKTGMACTLLSQNDLEKGIDHILEKVPKTQPIKIKYLNISGYLPKRKPRPLTYKPYHSTYLSNTVLGIKNRYVAFIETRLPEEGAMIYFSKILAKHKLPHLIVFKTINGYCGACLMTFQKHELIRLLKGCHSRNLAQFLKYRQNFLELDMSEPDRDSTLKMPIKILYGAQRGYFSKGHLKLFSYFSIPNYSKQHGSEEVKLTYAMETA
jgi:hypothetical protein